MTIEDRAARIARIVVSGSCNAFYVAGTQHQQNAVITEAGGLVLAELRQMEAEWRNPPSPLPERVLAGHLGPQD